MGEVRQVALHGVYLLQMSEDRTAVEAFAKVTATAPVRAFGFDGKGAIIEGFDADLAIWDPEASYTYGADDLHDNTGYNPFEGTTVKGMPRHVLSRG